MDFSESDEHALLRRAVADVAGTFGHEWFAARVRAGEKVDELWTALATHGFLGVNLPERYGGGGAGISELSIVGEEVAAAGCPLLTTLVSPAICGELLARYGTDAQRERWLPGIAAGERMAFAITEPDAGSNSHRIATTATRDGDLWRVTGQKTFISFVDEAAAVLVVVRTGTADDVGRGRLSLLVVDTDAAGLSTSPIPVEIALPDKQFLLFFDDVQVPDDRRVGAEGDGLRIVFDGLNPERIMGASLCNGVGRYVLGVAAAYANERRVWDGVPIGAHQGVAHPLAIAKIELELARLMTQRAAWLHDHADDRAAAGEAANMAKYAAAEAAAHCLDAAIQTLGGNGLATEYGVADLWGVVRLLRIAPVSREMILNFVASRSLGLPKSY
ncbi:MAG TPA: acyl-CoA dehydrogenase family protein [Acidimicrobiales bacterium]|nr:acyl-CoA dehydrogenase family protein [Acidimicrobiales bacterium]